ncbi:MAG: hypothetical protein K5886_09130 [Lachnospiraceae bacterium]|nr:hypothetical protein [Lachnospiraceae bacterium]
MNSETDIELRKYKKNIEVSGFALIIIGMWTTIKYLIMFSLGSDSAKSISSLYHSYDNVIYRIIVIISTALTFIIIFSIYCYIGRSAIKYAAGKKQSTFFLFIALFLLIATIVGIPSYFLIDSEIQGIETVIASILVDISTCIMLYDIISSVFRIRKLLGNPGHSKPESDEKGGER